MRPILLYGVVDGLPSHRFAIYVHVTKALSKMAAVGSERDECKGFRSMCFRPFSSMAFDIPQNNSMRVSLQWNLG